MSSIEELLNELKNIDEDCDRNPPTNNISGAILSLKTSQLTTEGLDSKSAQSLRNVFQYIQNLKTANSNLNSEVQQLNSQLETLTQSGMTSKDYISRLLSFSNEITNLKNEYGKLVSRGTSNTSQVLALTGKISSLELQVEILKEAINSKSSSSKGNAVKNLGDLLLAYTAKPSK